MLLKLTPVYLGSTVFALMALVVLCTTVHTNMILHVEQRTELLTLIRNYTEIRTHDSVGFSMQAFFEPRK